MFSNPIVDTVKRWLGLGGASEPAPAIPAFCPGARGSLKFKDPRLEENYLLLREISDAKILDLTTHGQLSQHITSDLEEVAKDIYHLRNSGPSAGSHSPSLTAKMTERENRHLTRHREEMSLPYRDVIRLKREFYNVFDPAYDLYATHELYQLTRHPRYRQLVEAAVLAYVQLDMVAPAEAHIPEMEIEFLLEMM